MGEFLGPWASLGPTPGTGPGVAGNGRVQSPSEVLLDGYVGGWTDTRFSG